MKHSIIAKFTPVIAILSLGVLVLSGCSTTGKSKTKIAPYTVLKQDGQFEVRHYKRLVFVSTSMERQPNRGRLFRKLFAYISGSNQQSQKIDMTAPVFMGSPDDDQQTMSFVLPKTFSLDSAPAPRDSAVKLQELKDYTVAVICFSGHLEQPNIQQHRQLLEKWVSQKQLPITGPVNVAGYNRPSTPPELRRNEVMIPVKFEQ